MMQVKFVRHSSTSWMSFWMAAPVASHPLPSLIYPPTSRFWYGVARVKWQVLDLTHNNEI